MVLETIVKRVEKLHRQGSSWEPLDLKAAQDCCPETTAQERWLKLLTHEEAALEMIVLLVGILTGHTVLPVWNE